MTLLRNFWRFLTGYGSTEDFPESQEKALPPPVLTNATPLALLEESIDSRLETLDRMLADPECDGWEVAIFATALQSDMVVVDRHLTGEVTGRIHRARPQVLDLMVEILNARLRSPS